MQIYPNPASDNLTIETPQKATIEILNIEGQVLKSMNTEEVHATLDISGFARGMYFIKVKTEKGVAVKKFVKE
ncbi:MAG: T9SS type A sorting domain-containing protein [Bacteroidales bacterium]